MGSEELAQCGRLVRREWKWRYPIPEGRDVVEVNVDLRIYHHIRGANYRKASTERCSFDVSCYPIR